MKPVPDSEPPFSIDRVEGKIFIRVSRLLKKLQTNPSTVSEQIQAALESRERQTDIDVLASLLGAKDLEVATAAAEWIEVQSRENVEGADSIKWWSSSKTVKRLMAGLKGQHPQVRRNLLKAYSNLQFGEPSEILQILLNRLRDPESESFALTALKTIQELGTDLASGAVNELCQLMEDPSQDVRSMVYDTLEWLGSEAQDAVPCLVQRIVSREPDQTLRKRATLALVAICKTEVTSIPALDSQGREDLVEALRRIEEKGRGLRRALSSPNQTPNSPPEESSVLNADSQVWMIQTGIADFFKVNRNTVVRWLEDEKLVPREVRTTGIKQGRKEYLFDHAILEALRQFHLGKKGVPNR